MHAGIGVRGMVAHPTLERLLAEMMPVGREYAGSTIPVLQTAGYFPRRAGGRSITSCSTTGIIRRRRTTS